MERNSEVPQIRINKLFKGYLSTWWSINGKGNNIDATSTEEQDQVIDELRNEGIDGKIKFMILETIEPAGRYFRIKISDETLKK